MIYKQHIAVAVALIMAAISLSMSWVQQRALTAKDLARALDVTVCSTKLPPIADHETLQLIFQDYNDDTEILAQFSNTFGEEQVWLLTQKIDRTSYRISLVAPTKKTSVDFTVPPYEGTWSVGDSVNYKSNLMTWSHNQSGSSRSTIYFRIVTKDNRYGTIDK